MFARLLDWFDDRTGCRQAIAELLYHRIPGGPRWRYTWGTALLFAVVVEFITGFFLWMHYSPSTQTAWESVFYIQFEMSGGDLLRGLHHYTAHAVMILLALHLLQVVIYGAYRAPREVNFGIGLAAMLVLLLLGQTGYLLPWDQRGYQAMRVATTIAGATPMVGDQIKAIALGGSELGHHTLTHFFALHAGLFPAVLLGLIGLHIAIGRRHGLTTPATPSRPDTPYWPDQALRDGAICLVVLATVWQLTTRLPVELGPPADPTIPFDSARPEWYFRFLFQALKYFHGEQGMFIASQLIPGAVLAVMVLMPWIGRWKLGHRFNVLFVITVLGGIATLTGVSLQEDYNGTTEKSQHYLTELALARADAERAHQLAAMGVPPEGVKHQLRNDPKTAGYRLYQQHCAACHAHYDHAAEDPHRGDPLLTVVVDEPTAANLYRFGSREWLEGLLDPEQIGGPHYFGNTVFAEGDMVDWVNSNIRDELEEMESSEQNAYLKKVQATAWAISAAAQLPYQREADARDTAQIEAGRQLAIDELMCIDCHKLGKEGDFGAGPDLTGYATREWLVDFLRNPHAERFYYSEENYDQPSRLMPPFAPHVDQPELNALTERELELIVDWLRQDWPMPEKKVISPKN